MGWNFPEVTSIISKMWGLNVLLGKHVGQLLSICLSSVAYEQISSIERESIKKGDMHHSSSLTCSDHLREQ